MTTAVEIAKDYGYSIELWETFRADPRLPEGLLHRAMANKSALEAEGNAVTHVLYDVDDDDQGFLLVGDNPEAMCLELEPTLNQDARWSDVETPAEVVGPRV